MTWNRTKWRLYLFAGGAAMVGLAIVLAVIKLMALLLSAVLVVAAVGLLMLFAAWALGRGRR